MLNDHSGSDAYRSMNPFGSKQLSQQLLAFIEFLKYIWHSVNINFLDVLFYLSVSLQREVKEQVNNLPQVIPLVSR